MDSVRIIEVKENILIDNDAKAQELRNGLKKDGTFLVNLMSSPGSGKTSTILRTVEHLRDELKIGIIEADIDSAVDAEKLLAAQVPAIQVHNGGMCHLDASMTEEALKELDAAKYDLVFLENIGNLVCPAEFDTGAVCDMMLLSVPEGDDKPLKYPLMFSKVDVLLVNKIDCMSFFDFDMAAMRERVLALNPDVKIFEVSAKTGEGFAEWAAWLRQAIKDWMAQ